jgi:hypothetical protein
MEPKAAGPTSGRPFDWTTYGEWIQLFSRSSRDEATRLATEYRDRFLTPLVFAYDNGWFAGVVGPFPSGAAAPLRDQFVHAGLIPRDSLVVNGMHFSGLAWG